ncbi:hypothetical protein FQR65_LT14282 [Abscondita terminalis]|nr:hypothetical protein FQR65_LT14282 [Abscondita terminalis]
MTVWVLFDVLSKHGAFFTGGNVEWMENALFCQTSSSVSIFDIEFGSVTGTIGEENSENADELQTFTVSNDKIVTSHKSGLLKLWKHDGTLEKMWKSIHKGPIARLRLKGMQLASGGSDGVVRVWNLTYQACTLSLKDCVGVINVVEYHNEDDFIFGSGDDGKIHAWGLEKGDLIRTFSGHFSKVTSIAFHHDGKHFMSAGRDRVVVLWTKDSSTAVRVVPTFEALESVVCLPNSIKILGEVDNEGIHVATAGNNGVIRVWDLFKAKEIYAQSNSLVSKPKEEGGLAITHLLFNTKIESFAVVSSEHNIILHDLNTFQCTKQFVGFSDEILDLALIGKDDSHLAVATNSADIKLYETSTMNCSLLKGHTDLVLSLASASADPNLLLSSAKDNTIRIWRLHDKKSAICVAVGIGHTGSVDSVTFNNLNISFVASGSQDTCLKLWEIPDKFEAPSNLICKYTEVAHEKGINSVVVSPNDKIIATGSQDKTAKLWSESLQLLGVLRGHKRGIWCVRFSPVDQVLLTSSTDSTVKLWSITELNCLKTIEGHEASVHRAEFISNGLQILSAGADGLIKLFNVKTSECVSTYDQHDARVWALCVNRDESGFISGGADSLLIKWKDVTKEKRLEKIKEAEELALQEQQLNNYMYNDELLKALQLALKLNRPFQTLKIVQGIIRKGGCGLIDTIHQLRNDQKEDLLKCATEWNTNSRNCHPAQLVLNILIKELQTGDFRPVGLSGVIEGTLPYTERHFKRVTQLLQDLHFINYTINCMQPHAKNAGQNIPVIQKDSLDLLRPLKTFKYISNDFTSFLEERSLTILIYSHNGTIQTQAQRLEKLSERQLYTASPKSNDDNPSLATILFSQMPQTTPPSEEQHTPSPKQTVSIPPSDPQSCPPLEGDLDKLTVNQFVTKLTHECRYDRVTRPPMTGPFNVTVQIDIMHIEAVEQLQFKTHMLMQYRYIDYRLKYKEISPKRGVMLGEDLLRKKIWVPHIVLTNERENSIMGLEGNDQFVSISPEGEIIYSYRMTATIYCWMDLKKFPFDAQECHLEFRSWTYNASKLILNWDNMEPVKVANQLHLTEFELEGYRTYEKLAPASLTRGAFVGNYSVLVFEFKLQREIGFYIMDYFIPSILLVATSWVTFWLQADNAAPRVTLGTSTMLAFITLAQGQSRSLPRVSYIKASEIWFLGCTIFIFLSMAEFAFVNIIWRRRKKVELKKVNSKYILKSTLTPKLARKELEKSSSMNQLQKSHSCSSLNECGCNNKDASYNNYLTVHSFPSTMEIPRIQTEADNDLMSTDSQLTIPVPNNRNGVQDKNWTSMTPQEVAIWIDKRSRIVFPAAFIVFNILYWAFVYGL